MHLTAGEVSDFVEHDITMNVLGSMLLWTGWYGFNTTGAVHVGDEDWGSIVARVGVNTTLAPATAAVVVCYVSWYHKRFVNVPATVRESQRVCVRERENDACVCACERQSVWVRDTHATPYTASVS